jgi:5-methylcytosine-specific restriction endonuclease McrA
MKVHYGEKLFDQRWLEKRKRILTRDNNKCVICSKSKNESSLHVHHKQYHFIKRLEIHVEPWAYNDKLLVTLCESCHNRGHYRYQVPVKYL